MYIRGEKGQGHLPGLGFTEWMDSDVLRQEEEGMIVRRTSAPRVQIPAPVLVGIGPSGRTFHCTLSLPAAVCRMGFAQPPCRVMAILTVVQGWHVVGAG